MSDQMTVSLEELKAEQLVKETKLIGTGEKQHYRGTDRFGNIWFVYHYENEQGSGWCGFVEAKAGDTPLDRQMFTDSTRRDVCLAIADFVIAEQQVMWTEVTEAVSTEPLVLVDDGFTDLEKTPVIVGKNIEVLVPEKRKATRRTKAENQPLAELKVRENRRYDAGQIIDMRRMAADKYSFAAIARKYACSTQFVRNVVKRFVYKDVVDHGLPDPFTKPEPTATE